MPSTSAGGITTPLDNDPVADGALIIRTIVGEIGDPWTSYTPTWTAATTNPAIGNGTITAAYRRIGKTVHFRIQITMGSTTTYGAGAWFLTLPVAPVAGEWMFTGLCRDLSATNEYITHVRNTTGSTIAPRTLPPTAGNPLIAVTATAPFTWASTDVLFVSGSYQAA